MLNERRRRVLQALVNEYISSATPVGSKTLVTRYELGCSSATVRNELSILEETGYVVQPHVSAGRMPTDIGYRDFVDAVIARIGEAESRPASMPNVSEVDELMRETSAMLTRLTNSLAVVIAPSVSLARVKRIDVLSMSAHRALFVLITESGQVLNRHIELVETITPEGLSDVERSLNAALVNKRATEIRPVRDALSAARPDAGRTPDDEVLLGHMIDEILDMLAEADRDRLYHVGIPALLAQPEFHDTERALPLIKSLEDGLVLLETLSETLPACGVTVRIGHENRRAEFGDVSLVATTYGASGGDGVIGVIGPTRMDYERAIEAVRAVADGLSEALA